MLNLVKFCIFGGVCLAYLQQDLAIYMSKKDLFHISNKSKVAIGFYSYNKSTIYTQIYSKINFTLNYFPKLSPLAPQPAPNPDPTPNPHLSPTPKGKQKQKKKQIYKPLESSSVSDTIYERR